DTKAGKITANIVNGVASEIIQPNSVGYMSMCDNNWVSTKKFIFLLKVKSLDPTGVEINSYIQGYTEFDGITSSGHIDAGMVHFINNVIETTTMTLNTPLGVIRKEKLYRIYNVFSNGGFNEMFTQRPSDVLENINLLNMSQMINDPGLITQHMGSYMNSVDTKALSSGVDNNITTEYLSKILTTGLHDVKNKDIFINSYEINNGIAPEARLPEPSVHDNRFLKYISRAAGFKIVREFFTFQTLMQVDPTIYNRFKVINLTKNYVDPTMMQTPEVGDYWHGQDAVTVKAYSLIENAVSLATKYGFNKIYFTASNMSNPMQVAEVFITNFNSFINLEEHEFNYLLEIFKEKFITEIFLSETNGGILPMHLEAYIDLLGTSKINLTFAGFPSNWFTIPTFANSLFAPVVSIDKQAVDLVSYQLGSVIDTLSTQFNVPQSYY
ncbi:MAG: hypothetical protein HGA25_00495, partial [Clostridiales bacterium]|nr:hypothetical protein [Clostridiales bacterium]